MEISKSGKLNQLQIIRAIAFLGIFLCHCGIKDLGAWGVSVFFILSGFVMVYSNINKPIYPSITKSFSFSLSKIKKLYSLHILTLIFVKIYYYLNSTAPLLSHFYPNKVTISNLLLLHAWIPVNTFYFSLNGVSWYLSVCLFIYICFPYILNYIKKNHSVIKLFFVSLFIYVLQGLVGYSSQHIPFANTISNNFPFWITYICPLFRLGDFFIGCIAGYIYVNVSITIKPILSTAIEIITILVIYISSYIYENQLGRFGKEAFRNTVLFTPSSVILIFIFALGSGYISKFLTKIKPLIFLGNISGYTFLIHFITIKYIKLIYHNLFNADINKTLLFLVALASTIGLSIIYIYIESIIKKLIDKTRAKNNIV